MSLTLRGNIGRRLTIAEMDDNFIYLENISGGGGDSSIFYISAAQASDMVDDNQIVPNATYYITGVHDNDVFPSLYGGTDIVVKGITSSQFTSNGYGKFFNPKYASYSVWDTQASYEENDVVIYGGSVWINKGNFDPNDNYDVFTLNNSNWEIQSYSSSYYTEVWDEIEYDIRYNWITSRYDVKNNNLVKVNFESGIWYYCGVTPIKMFRWGHNLFDNGVSSCEIINSYFGCLNFVSGSIVGVTMDNFSNIYDFQMRNGSTFQLIKLSNNSTINTFSLDNTDFQNIVLENNSEISDFSFINGDVENVKLNHSDLSSISGSSSNIEYLVLNNSSIVNSQIYGDFNNVILSNDSLINNLIMDENSEVNSISMNDSDFEDITLSNESEFSDIQMYDSYLGQNTLDNSYFSDISIYDSGIYSNILVNSDFSDIEMHDSNVYGVYLTSSSIDDVNLKKSNLHTNSIESGGIYASTIINNSQLVNLTFTQSSCYGLNLDNSNMNTVTLNSNYMEFIYLRDANLENFNNGIIQLDMTGAEFDFNGASCSLPIYTSFNTNTLKYQFNLNLDGSEGNGTVGNIPYFETLFVPSGFYIEKIIIDSETITTENDNPSTFTLGIMGLSPSSGIGGSDGDVTQLSNSIKVFDISNGKTTGGKASTNTTLSAQISNHAITSGQINMEVILKNTSYGSNND